MIYNDRMYAPAAIKLRKTTLSHGIAPHSSTFTGNSGPVSAYFISGELTGKERDPETGLYYYGARYLDPRTSRWLSVDPAMGEYIPLAPINDDAKKHNENLPGMGGVFNIINLHVYHYSFNNPIRINDPDGRSGIDEIIENAKNANWENPVFMLGISVNGTGPGISAGNTTGMYFVPNSKDDSVFYAAFASFAFETTSILPGSSIRAASALLTLISRSSDFGFFTDIMSSGTGGGMSAGIGVTIGVFSSIDNFRGFFNESGFSVGKLFTIGADAVFNTLGAPVGYTATIGIGVQPGFEAHSRFGNNFVFSVREQIHRRR